MTEGVLPEEIEKRITAQRRLFLGLKIFYLSFISLFVFFLLVNPFASASSAITALGPIAIIIVLFLFVLFTPAILALIRLFFSTEKEKKEGVGKATEFLISFPFLFIIAVMCFFLICWGLFYLDDKGITIELLLGNMIK